MGFREIIFKAKRLDNGEWIEGSLIDSGNHGQVFIFPPLKGASIMPCRKNVYYEMVGVDSDTICQYTGLCDKNGRKIWENDIVDMNRKGCGFKRIEKVFYEEGAFSPISVHGWECVPDADEIEVIGNIFDNPELLEGN